MPDNQFYGWFDDAQQTKATFDPPRDGPCLFCGRAIDPADVRTHSIMHKRPEYAKRSYFYRTHRTCDDRSPSQMDDAVFEMIERNGD